MEKSSFDLNLSFVPVNVSDFLKDISMIDNVHEKITKLKDYACGLEKEKEKIHGLKNELPICMVLINDALERLKLEIKEMEGRPSVNVSMSSKDDCSNFKKHLMVNELVRDSEKTSSWLNSNQLWKSDMKNKSVVKESSCSIFDMTYDQISGKLTSSGGRAFVSCNRQATGVIIRENNEFSPINLTRIGSGMPIMANLRRKQRRCWSPELHRGFMWALQELGGPHVATPKQIKDKMQVEDLTNDEVKSHLQKYKLHARKLPSSSNTAPPDSFAPPNCYGAKPSLSLPQYGSSGCPLIVGSSKGVSTSVVQDDDNNSETQNSKGLSQKASKDRRSID